MSSNFQQTDVNNAHYHDIQPSLRLCSPLSVVLSFPIRGIWKLYANSVSQDGIEVISTKKKLHLLNYIKHVYNSSASSNLESQEHYFHFRCLYKTNNYSKIVFFFTIHTYVSMKCDIILLLQQNFYMKYFQLYIVVYL